MNVSHLRRNNVNIALANYVEMCLPVPQCARGRPLSDPLKWDHRISKFTSVSVTSVALDLRQAITC